MSHNDENMKNLLDAYMLIVSNILKKYSLLYLSQSKEWMFYENGIFNLDFNLKNLKQIINNEYNNFNLDRGLTIPHLNIIISLLQSKVNVSRNYELMWGNNLESRIYCINGYYDLRIDQFEKYDSVYKKHTHYSTTYINAIYNEDARCPEIHRFLESHFKYRKISVAEIKDNIITQLHIEKVPLTDLIYEIIAYCCFSSIKYQKAFIIKGTDKRSKNIFTNLLKSFFPFYTSVDVNSLNSRLGLSSIRNKSINIYSIDHLSFIHHNSSRFKKTLRDGILNTYLKYRKNAISFKNTIKHIFFTESLSLPFLEIPKVQFWDNWIIVNIDSLSNSYSPYTFFSEEEHSGLLNQCIKSWKYLEERGDFESSYHTITRNTQKQWNLR